MTKVTRGLWCRPTDPRFSTYGLVPFLASSHPAYVSLFSALWLHDMVEQIPQSVFVATTAHSRVVATPLQSFSFHQLSPEYFGGFDWYGERDSFLIASPEKAIVDCLYLSSRKGRRFGRFPELRLRAFRIGRARRWVRSIADPALRSQVCTKLEVLWQEHR